MEMIVKQGKAMARPNGSKKVRGWMITPEVAKKAGVSLSGKLSKEDTDKLLAARKSLKSDPGNPGKRKRPIPFRQIARIKASEPIKTKEQFQKEFEKAEKQIKSVRRKYGALENKRNATITGAGRSAVADAGKSAEAVGRNEYYRLIDRAVNGGLKPQDLPQSFYKAIEKETGNNILNPINGVFVGLGSELNKNRWAVEEFL